MFQHHHYYYFKSLCKDCVDKCGFVNGCLCQVAVFIEKTVMAALVTCFILPLL